MTTTETKTKNDNGLADMVQHIADTINSGEYEPKGENGCEAYDYLSDALDFRWIVQNDLEFIGARVLVAFGGPNIWIDTTTQKVEGYWWGDYAEASYHKDPMGLNDAVEDLYRSRLDEAKRRK
jgi:hypothetical protein